jgi:competence protein ComEC
MLLLEQRLFLFPWSPVCLGAGIGVYFALRFEPDWMFYVPIAVACLACVVLALRWGPDVSPLFWAIALMCCGVLLAGGRAFFLDHPVLEWRYYGPIQGRVVDVDRSASDALRLTLDRVVLADISPSQTPARVRLSLHGDWPTPKPLPGQIVMTTGHLAPPAGAVEPGGFDFKRHAFFRKLGGVGYTRNPVVLWQADQTGVPIGALRAALSARVQSALPGNKGAFAAAVTTGDRSAMHRDTLDALRASNLAHLLAISGLHMGLLANVVFGACRLALAAVPALGLRIPVKKIAAAVALCAAAGYLLLSGGNVATERAFVMVAVMFVALILDRRAFSLRAVSVAAFVVLFLRPESLLSPGFQMSFAATTALVAVFAWVRDSQFSLGARWMRPVLALVLSSAMAGAATAPFGAAHFNQLSQYGLLANLVSVPLMGTVVIPMAVVAACLMPFGGEAVAFWVMGHGLAWILWVADWVAGMEGAIRPVHSPVRSVLPLMTIGALVVILWQGRLRWIGIVPCLLALGFWIMTPRPALLIDESGALVGVMTKQGRALNKPKGQGFSARSWLENDGDMSTQAEAANRWPVAPIADGFHLRIVTGKAARQAQCHPNEWLVSNQTLPANLPCQVTDKRSLQLSGAIALYETSRGEKIVTQRQITGCRRWTRCKRAMIDNSRTDQ